VGAASLAVKGFIDIMERVGKVQGVERAFKRTAISLEGLRDATRGTISDFDLMQKAVIASTLGVGNLETLFKFASIRARETGQSVDFLVQSLVEGIGKKSTMVLDNLGISLVRIQKEMKETGDFATAAFNIVNEDLEQMNENIAPMADNVDRLGSAFSNLYDEVLKVLGTGAEEGGVISFFADALEGLVKYVNFWYGDGSKVFEELKRVADEEIFFDDEPFTERVAITYEYAKAWAEVNNEIERMSVSFKEVAPLADKTVGKFADKFETTAEKLSGLSNQLIDTFDYVFTETLIREQNFIDSMVAGFASMLLNLFTGGAFGIAAGGIGSFITGGLFSHDGAGLSPRGGGGSTVNINMPNVAMINSKSIRQIRQAISRHDRLH
jgi:hypothetical protein